MKPGDEIWVRVFKADGEAYRWWRAYIEEMREDCFIMHTSPGHMVYQNPRRFKNAIFQSKWHIRSYYWPGKRHNLLEVYRSDGRLYEVYADIISPVSWVGDELHFIDHELDVQQFVGDEARIIDQDEFAEAAAAFGYSEAFVSESYALAEQLLKTLTGWTPLGYARRIAAASAPH